MTRSLFSTLCFTLVFRKSLSYPALQLHSIPERRIAWALIYLDLNAIAIDLASHDSYTDPLFPYSELQMKFCR